MPEVIMEAVVVVQTIYISRRNFFKKKKVVM